MNLSSYIHNSMQPQVVQGQSSSNEFPVTNDIEHSAYTYIVLSVPTLYLTAVLEASFEHVRKGVCTQARHDVDLFKVSQFQSKTRTTKYLVGEMLFSDDSALVAYSAEDIQVLVDQLQLHGWIKNVYHASCSTHKYVRENGAVADQY